MGKRKVLITVIILVVVLLGATAGYAAFVQGIGTDGLVAVGGNEATTSEGDSNSADSADGKSSSDNDQSSSGSETIEAPNFTMTTPDGQEVTLDSFRGKPVVLNFWTSWCTLCNQEMPGFQGAYDKLGDKVNFVMLDATSDPRETAEKAAAYIADNGYTFPYYLESSGEALSLYGITGFPTTFIIDSEGYVAAYAASMVEEDSLVHVLEELLKE